MAPLSHLCWHIAAINSVGRQTHVRVHASVLPPFWHHSSHHHAHLAYLPYIKSPARQPLSHVLPRSYGLKYCCSHNHTPLFLGGSIHRRCSKPSVHSVTLRCKCRISLLPHDCLLSGRKVACIRALPANKCWHASGAAIQKYVRWF